MPRLPTTLCCTSGPPPRPLAFIQVAAVLFSAVFLAGCASPAHDQTVYVLQSEPPVAAPAPTSMATPWQLVLPVRVPEYLDRDTLLLPQGAHAMQVAAKHVWAEPLSRSVPRVLSQDLRALRGAGSLWTAPLGGVAVQGQLRVELLALNVDPGGRSVSLQARWSTHPQGEAKKLSAQPMAHTTRLTVDSTGPEVVELVNAHRLALWQLAQAISHTLSP